MVYIVVLMMVAGFLALRLYSVLGKRTGHEQPLVKPAEERVAAPVMPRTIDVPAEARGLPTRNIDKAAEDGVRAIVSTEPTFDLAQFLEGAKAAYRMTMEAFWSGDRAALRTLADDGVFDAFDGAIAEREAAGLTLDNRLVAIEQAQISAAQLSGREARITVRFDSVIAAVTRDGEGHVVAGSTDDAVESHDLWTFARTLRSDDPNWMLVDTDEA